MVAFTKQVLIRVDAGHQRGYGHLYRMMVLCHCFHEYGYSCHFIIRPDPAAEKIISQNGYTCLLCDQEAKEIDIIAGCQKSHGDALLWIYDILSTKCEWIEMVRNMGMKTVCFDDLGGGVAADLVINAITGCWVEGLDCDHVLKGPEFAILNPAIRKLNYTWQPYTSNIKVGLTFGGSDTHGTTLQILRLLIHRSDVSLHVFLGPGFIFHTEVEQIISTFRGTVYIRQSVEDLHQHLLEVDVVCCGGGQTLLEMCCMGIPILAVTNESHEVKTIGYFASIGACIDMCPINEDETKHCLDRFLDQILYNPEQVESMCLRAKQLVDGKGVYRCLDACLKLLI
jgi:spore coat polysaccharide biosynthesis predicted glycosyltransferase SpsG